jgi:hypothetical protein
MHLACRDIEVDPVKGNDLAKGLGDPARTDYKRRGPAGSPVGPRRSMVLGGCRESRQFVSGLGM